MSPSSQDISQGISKIITGYFDAAKKRFDIPQSCADKDVWVFDTIAEKLQSKGVTKTDVKNLVMGEFLEEGKCRVICEFLMAKIDQKIKNDDLQQVITLMAKLPSHSADRPEGEIKEQERRNNIAKKRAQEIELTDAGKHALQKLNPSFVTTSAHSFVEILRESYWRGEDFRQFVDALVLEWRASQAEIAEHIRSKKTSSDRVNFTETFFSRLKNREYWEEDTVKQFAKAFGFLANDITKSPDEIMFWRMQGDPEFNHKDHLDTEGKTRLEAVIVKIKNGGNFQELLREMIAASGIPRDLLTAAFPSVKGMLDYGTRAESLPEIISLVEILNPLWSRGLPPERIHAQNIELVELISNRCLDLGKIIQSSAARINPGASLFKKLLGTKGDETHALVFMNLEALEKHLIGKDIKTKKKDLGEMRIETKLPNRTYGQITEQIATEVVSVFKEKIYPAIHQGYLAPITPELEEQLVDMLTNIKNPKALFEQCKEGKTTPQSMLKEVGKRRGAPSARAIAEAICQHFSTQGKNQKGMDLLGEYADFTISQQGVEDYLASRSTTPIRAAFAFAHWMGLEAKDAQEYIVLARGHTLINPDTVLDQVMTKQIGSKEGFQKLFHATGMSRPELVESTGVKAYYIHSVLSSTGRDNIIVCATEAGTKLAEKLGLEHRVGDFIKHFCREPIVQKPKTATTASEASDLPKLSNRQLARSRQ